MHGEGTGYCLLWYNGACSMTATSGPGFMSSPTSGASTWVMCGGCGDGQCNDAEDHITCPFDCQTKSGCMDKSATNHDVGANKADVACRYDYDEQSSGNGQDYRGYQSKTKSGRTCQKWSSQAPHEHTFTTARYQWAGLEGNYCRNPTPTEKSIWCFTNDTDVRSEACSPDLEGYKQRTRKATEHTKSWSCQDGKQISSEMRCDKRIDCSDRSDEVVEDCCGQGCTQMLLVPCRAVWTIVLRTTSRRPPRMMGAVYTNVGRTIKGLTLRRAIMLRNAKLA
jgi:hypothetical protein